MRTYVFKKGSLTAFIKASNLSEAYGFLRDSKGSDEGCEWSGTNA